MGDGERNYVTTVEIKVLGALIGDGPNQEKPKRAIRETIVDVKLMRERVVLGDEAQFAEDKNIVSKFIFEQTLYYLLKKCRKAFRCPSRK